ncbi:antitoxin Xre/MbcA/ParS toxin-binding domain-containing protein [Azospirillum sp. TSO35-2]|uniref:type II RES/Xre toxin-antitoxin system antitoxin n=1 Tax=Azospirillum sp. TSO35-2 TaxID=716796 RepID=UPI000D62274C|nr:antitoxin Xre/MbcA/ParS toxin-binding domain-containing protein [Azospirillum sp. TSO35-2]PWC39485.1 antitoxin [Azospirillum sp. TSO35-2]
MPAVGSDAGRGEAGTYQRVTDLLGGPRVFKRPVVTQLDAHNAIKTGLPGGALYHLVTHLRVLKPASIESAVGMSVRTYQRRKGAPDKPLSPEQGGRTWKLAEILARASEVFGSQEEAEQWLERPAIGLDNNRPLDLLDTPAGVEMVEDYLGRMASGVYT